jgi:hypothetical protein
MRFSAIYRPTALFSLRDSNSTSSGAKSLLLPSPYAIKMAFISQAISFGGEDFREQERFEIIRDAKISYHIQGDFCVNNCFVKIQKQRDNEPFKSTVSFREYVFLDDDIEIIFEVVNGLFSNENIAFLKKYLYRINYFGKRGCFFQFVRYSDNPNEPNIKVFDASKPSFGILQEYDDFGNNLSFENVNSYSDANTKRVKQLLVLPLQCGYSSKSYTSYKYRV